MNKQEIIDILKKLGYTIEYDQWDIDDKEWIRFRHELDIEHEKHFALIFYKNHHEQSWKEAARILRHIGQWQKVRQLQSFV
jgi:hypothetical protein